MATAERVFWETVVVLGFIVLLPAFWILSGKRAHSSIEKAAQESRAAAQVAASEHDASLASLRQTCEQWADEQAYSEAEATFRGFRAGIQPAATARWTRFLGATKTALLEQERIAFVHLMTSGGRVLMSSDEDYSASGRVDELAGWALGTEKLETRRGDDGVLEIAAPVFEEGQPIAYLWLGYDVRTAKEQNRPEALSATG